MKNKVFILLDRSGSMENMWKEALGGINGYVSKLENADVMLAAFDTNGYDVIRNCSTSKWKNVTNDDVQPRGGTPLLDSAGRIIYNMLDSCAERAILVVVTDGHENASTKFKASEIKRLTSVLTDEKNYEVVFLGANFDGIGEVATQNFGVTDYSRVMRSTNTGFGSAMNATAAATSSYFASGIRATNFYSDADKKDAAS